MKERKRKKKNIIWRLIKFSPLITVMGFFLFFIIVVPGINLVQGEKLLKGAHRGSSVDYIENTLPAFEAALKNEKYKFIEFDIQYTKDKKLIVYHDRTLVRLNGVAKKVKSITYEEFLNISQFHVPLYSEVMNLIGTKKPINIEIKSQGDFEEDKKLVDFIVKDSIDRKIINNVLISSISSEVVKYIEDKYQYIKTGKIYFVTPGTFIPFDTLKQDMFNEMNKTNADYLMVHGYNLRNLDKIRELLPEGKTLVVWWFSDEMYVLEPQWYFGRDDLYALKPSLKRFIENLGKEDEDCVWWCE